MRNIIISLLFIILSFVSLTSVGQTNDSLSISFWTPPSWFSGDKGFLHDNLKNYKFSQEQMNRLANEINTSTVLGVYYKYNPEFHYGLIPTIKIYVRKNNSRDFDNFFVAAKNEIESVRSQVSNFKFIESPKTITIGKHKAFYATSSYNLNIQTGEIANVRTKYVCIPLENQYLYMTLIDNEEENCSDLFTEVISKILIK